MILKGREINIKLNGAIVAVAQSCEISINTDTIEVSNPGDGRWKKFIAGRSTWSVSIGKFVQAVEGDLNLLHREITLDIAKVQAGSTVTKLTGKAIVTQCSSSFSVGAMAKGSMQLQGSGPLS